MLFRSIDQEVQAAGGYMNAYTSFDRTVYWINVPNTGTRVAVDILCDIFQNATLPEDELIKELDVIRREMDMGQDDPGRRSGKRLFETAYVRSPYRHPIIGIPDIFNRITRSDLLAYYSEKYAPNNCFLVVVGDFDAAEVTAQVTQAYAGSGARAVPLVPIIPEPPQTAPREVVEEALLLALVRAGRATEAGALLEGRLHRRPSPLDRSRFDGLLSVRA